MGLYSSVQPHLCIRIAEHCDGAWDKNYGYLCSVKILWKDIEGE